MNPIHIFPPACFKSQFNITLPSTPKSPNWYFLLWYSNWKYLSMHFSTPHACYKPRPSDTPWFGHLNNTYLVNNSS
jgi:hypothetical protein